MSRSIQPRYLRKGALLQARLAAGITQAELGERVGATQAQISGWERSHTGCRIGMVHKLAGALGRQPADLMRQELLESTEDDEPDGAAA